MVRRNLILLFLGVVILLAVSSCSIGAPDLDEPEITAPAPSATAAG